MIFWNKQLLQRIASEFCKVTSGFLQRETSAMSNDRILRRVRSDFTTSEFQRVTSNEWKVTPRSGSACTDCTEDYGWSTRLVTEYFLAFYFSFSQFTAMTFYPFLLKFVFYLLHFRCFKSLVGGYYRLYGFKRTVIVYYNHSSLVILINSSKHIHFYPTFQLPPALSHCSYKPFIKPIELYLFHYKCWLNHLRTI